MKTILLASTSERRKELLSQMGVSFQVVLPKCDEIVPSETPASLIPALLARKKAESVANENKKNSLILAADTMILFNGRAIGKAKDKNEARFFLSSFSGKSHEVITGVALFNVQKNKIEMRSVLTRVEFLKMTDSEIDWLVEQNEWKDAAGAYKIQGKSGMFVKKIEGSYTNVVGLPISDVYDMLKTQGFCF